MNPTWLPLERWHVAGTGTLVIEHNPLTREFRYSLAGSEWRTLMPLPARPESDIEVAEPTPQAEENTPEPTDPATTITADWHFQKACERIMAYLKKHGRTRHGVLLEEMVMDPVYLQRCMTHLFVSEKVDRAWDAGFTYAVKDGAA